MIQAVFDLHLWPECKTVNEQTEDITWCIKLFNSDTLALSKDTDKEDREKALKASWEAAEPGRAEKATKSRQKYLALMKQKRGEKLTEEEAEALKEKRERVKKKIHSRMNLLLINLAVADLVVCHQTNFVILLLP